MMNQLTSEVRGVLTFAVAVATVLAASLAATASASWPTTPENPLLVGSEVLVLPQSAQPAIARSNDQATWVAWMDAQCVGNLRIQRIDASGEVLKVGGVVVESLSGCHTTATQLVGLPDGSAVVARKETNGLPLDTLRVHRIATDGTPMWGSGMTFDGDGSGRVVGLLGLSNSDVLIALHISNNIGQTIQVHRIGVDGQPVWDEPIVIPGQPVSLTLIADENDGALLGWDIHASPSYFRVIVVAKITSDGQPAWPEVTRVITPDHPFASRHTPHAFVSDGEGGLWISYTQGAEQAQTPRPIDVQRVRADGTIEFDEPLRVSLGSELQWSATSWRDAASGDLLVAWRDGAFAAQTLRVQRMTSTGERLFGQTGVMVRSLNPSMTSGLITGHWTGQTLLVSVADPPKDRDGAWMNMHRISADGIVDPDASPLSDPNAAFSLQNVAHGDSQVVLWMRQLGSFQMEPVVQLVHPDGTLGLVSNPGDLTGDGVVDGADLAILLSAWGQCEDCTDCPADLNGDCEIDGADLAILLSNWS